MENPAMCRAMRRRKTRRQLPFSRQLQNDGDGRSACAGHCPNDAEGMEKLHRGPGLRSGRASRISAMRISKRGWIEFLHHDVKGAGRMEHLVRHQRCRVVCSGRLTIEMADEGLDEVHNALLCGLWRAHLLGLPQNARKNAE
jgi:hypothetical protein